MKKNILLLLASFLTVNLIYSQGGWVLQYSSSKVIFGIDFIDVNTGIAVGNGGLILKTTNQGMNWISITAPDTTKTLTTIKYLDNLRIIIGGFQTIVKSSDGGNSWSSIVIPPNITDMDILGNKVLLCGNNKVINSTNGGDNWSEQTIPSVLPAPFLYSLKGLCFSDSITCYLVTEEIQAFPSISAGRILKSTNAGTNWYTIFTTYGPPGTGDNVFFDIFFINQNYGYASGKADLYYTTNAGVNWIDISVNSHVYTERILFLNSGTGYNIGAYPPIDGLNGVVKKTTDSGLTWYTQLSVHAGNYQSRFYGISFANINTGWVCGHIGGGVIYRTTNGGVTAIEPISSQVPESYSLSQNYPNPFNPATKIKFAISPSRGVSVGRGMFVKLLIYDMLGREVSVLVNEQLSQGIYEVSWDAGSYPSGVYFYKLSVRQAGSLAGDYSETKKMMLIK